MITPRTPKSEINLSDLNRDAVRQAHRDSDFLADIVGGFIQKLTNEEQQVLREQLDYYMDAGYVDDEGYIHNDETIDDHYKYYGGTAD